MSILEVPGSYMSWHWMLEMFGFVIAEFLDVILYKKEKKKFINPTMTSHIARLII